MPTPTRMERLRVATILAGIVMSLAAATLSACGSEYSGSGMSNPNPPPATPKPKPK